ncbi:hypothetical protein Bca52824_082077 [Brassica carinata]|uniref:Endonuclease/exonuclease/phosphatase domain-containing protein n=1 Tax=Brassica carinata TaxID=52824 RepID=A0A8X7TSI2_BRACI|nr:hypothetical protein Bca52824_082077 [Brassica carinata]
MSVKLFFWNVRGINDPDKHRPISDWLYSHRPIFGALLETHIKELCLARVMNSVCHDWHYLSNHLSDEDGRIVIIWKDPAKVTLLAQSRQMIKCEVELPNYPLFTYSAIYASNLSEERADLWVELLNTQATLSLDSKPWMIGGDFNQILHSHEHSTFCHSVHSSRMFEFRDILLQLGVNDLRYYGPVHTRTNNRDIAHVAKKLDRCLINSQILTAFPNATSTFLPPAPSDHTPCLTDLACQLPIVGTQTFRFLNYLTKHPSFLEVVTDAWFLAGSVSVNLASLCWKLKYIKRSLKMLNKENYSNIQQRVQETYGLLQHAQLFLFFGRLLLIKTLIAGVNILVFKFHLAKISDNKINSMCGLFLWKGSSEGHHTAKVSWETVTLTKEQGGLESTIFTLNKAAS